MKKEEEDQRERRKNKKRKIQEAWKSKEKDDEGEGKEGGKEVPERKEPKVVAYQTSPNQPENSTPPPPMTQCARAHCDEHQRSRRLHDTI